MRQDHIKLRKRGGQRHQDFLNALFIFPAIEEIEPRAEVPSEINGVGDENTLRLQNVTLTAELTNTKNCLDDEQQRAKDLQRERDAAKRKASIVDDLRKKQKADHEKVRYYQKQIQEQNDEAKASEQLKTVEREKNQMEEHVASMEFEILELREKLEKSLNEKVVVS